MLVTFDVFLSVGLHRWEKSRQKTEQIQIWIIFKLVFRTLLIFRYPETAARLNLQLQCLGAASTESPLDGAAVY